MTSFSSPRSVEDRDDGCSDNLIDIGMVLTSGYRSEIDSVDQTGDKLFY